MAGVSGQKISRSRSLFTKSFKDILQKANPFTLLRIIHIPRNPFPAQLYLHPVYLLKHINRVTDLLLGDDA